MDELGPLRPKLTRLKLSGMLETLQIRLESAMNEQWSYCEFLELLLTDEIERRDFKQLTRRLTKSELNPEKSLESFDFNFNPRIHRPTIKELAEGHFIEKKENLFLLGPSGVGKSHLAQAIGNLACRKGYDTLFKRTDLLFKWIHSGRGDGSYERRLKSVYNQQLLILDDFGLNPLTELQQMDLYEVISQRYEKYSTIITSNRDFNEWPMIFSNPLMGSAAMDRLVHRAYKIVIEGKSYRVSTFSKRLTEYSKKNQKEIDKD